MAATGIFRGRAVPGTRSRRRCWRRTRATTPGATSGALPPPTSRAEDLLRCANEAYDVYRSENGLFAASAYPSLAACERALIAGVLDLLHAPAGAGGSATAGGTESILMAMKAARDWARETRPVSGTPEVVVPMTAHAAFDKGAEWLGMRVVRMGRSERWRADVAGMAAAVTDNTVMIAGSAPPYPYGEIDPIEEIAQLAREHDLWMHSDGCIGGMILPFMKTLGDAIPPFDFAVPGVTSMSVDMHKFGYAHKGISLCLLRDAALERYHRTTFEGWPAGTYSTPTITGTRSGGGVASAWAVMTMLGEEGYLRIFEAQRRIRDRLIEGIGAIEGLWVLGRPHALHVTVCADGFDIFAVEEGMAARGWRSIRMREPESILLWVNMKHAASIDDYLADLAEVAARVRAEGLSAATRGASSYAT